MGNPRGNGDSWQRLGQRWLQQTMAEKNALKAALFQLFKNGHKPDAISDEILAELLQITVSSNKKRLNAAVQARMSRLFDCGRDTALNMLYQRYQADQQQPKS